MSRILNAIPNGLALGAMALAQSQALAVDQTGQAAAGSVVLSPWHLLIVIGIAGFFGGMVDGLRSDRHYKWRFGDFAKEWGTLGDALVGVTAALAIFAFAENIFGSERFTGSITVYSLLKLVAWGVLSGYAGTKLLDPLTTKAVKEMAKAYYNRACYKTLAAAPNVVPPDAVDDLLEAVRLDENLKQYAVDDPDLTKLRKHPKLTFLVPPHTPEKTQPAAAAA